MICSYKDLMILLSNFDLDRIDFQSDNSICFDWLNNSKKRIMLQMSLIQCWNISGCQNLRNYLWKVYKIENYIASYSILTIFVNLTLVEVSLILSMLRYLAVFRMNGGTTCGQIWHWIESLARITNIISNYKPSSMSAFMKISIVIVAVAFIIVFVTI